MLFSNDSLELTKELKSNEIKENGIFFTPNTIITKCFKIIMPYLPDIKLKILEPSCGSMEFINYILKKEAKGEINYDEILCIEKNKTIYDKIKYKEKDKIKILIWIFLILMKQIKNMI